LFVIDCCNTFPIIIVIGYLFVITLVIPRSEDLNLPVVVIILDYIKRSNPKRYWWVLLVVVAFESDIVDCLWFFFSYLVDCVTVQLL